MHTNYVTIYLDRAGFAAAEEQAAELDKIIGAEVSVGHLTVLSSAGVPGYVNIETMDEDIIRRAEDHFAGHVREVSRSWQWVPPASRRVTARGLNFYDVIGEIKLPDGRTLYAEMDERGNVRASLVVDGDPSDNPAGVSSLAWAGLESRSISRESWEREQSLAPKKEPTVSKLSGAFAGIVNAKPRDPKCSGCGFIHECCICP